MRPFPALWEHLDLDAGPIVLERIPAIFLRNR